MSLTAKEVYKILKHFDIIYYKMTEESFPALEVLRMKIS